RGLQRESTVEITGVTMPPEHPATRHVNPLVAGNESFLQVLISDASDLVIISRPPWWTPGRLTALLAATAGAEAPCPNSGGGTRFPVGSP
ncbi:MAG: hypothetical protein EBT74_07205, partial [Gammaproteobacteria bacterium]|nr:hypothetical protein [Gammaproteobacteria bacterium]